MENRAIRAITVEEFEHMSFPEEFDVELINGKIVCKAKPNGVHQRLNANLTEILNRKLKDIKSKCILFPEIDVVFNDLNKEAPDLVILCDLEKYNKGEGKKIIGAPEIVIEILSPSTKHEDENEKFHIYMNCGVKEYWVVDPYTESICQYIPHKDGNGYSMKKYSIDDCIAAQIICPMELSLREIFDDSFKLVKDIFLKYNKIKR